MVDDSIQSDEKLGQQQTTDRMDSRPDWIEETDQPAMVVLASNHLSRMARKANQITDEVTKIRQRVDKMIQTFERTQGILSHGQNPDVEILRDEEDLESVLHDVTQKKRYQQKLTVFIVGYEETCGQRRHLLTQLQEFFSIYSNLNEEEDQKLEHATMDLDGIVYQYFFIHDIFMVTFHRKPSDDRGRKKLEKVLDQARQDIGHLTDQLIQAQEGEVLLIGFTHFE
ncbi:uncharacterized protein [Pyxicephalus adspersus]|uniref:uncharacterized protein n=1 Tax=Pyxicephalus adspersus TaxID=30357 RepID=UPI003B594F05